MNHVQESRILDTAMRFRHGLALSATILASYMAAPEVAYSVPDEDPVKIAVIDSGISGSLAHMGPGVNTLDGSPNTADGSQRRHGTEMARTIEERISHPAVARLCLRKCQILPIKLPSATVSSTEEYDTVQETIIRGINYATIMGADVINMSLEVPGSYADHSFNPNLLTAIANATNQGISVVVAAGNGTSTNPFSNVLASESPSAIRVAGVGEYEDTLLEDSNHGPWVDVAADGTSPAGLQGTSPAAAEVSAAAALLEAQDPTLSPAQIKFIVMKSGNRVRGLDVACHCMADQDAALKSIGYVAPVPVTVSKRGKGNGKVSVAGEVCKKSCTTWLDIGKTLKLRASPQRGSRFQSWEGACAKRKKRPTCTVSATRATHVSANFALKKAS